MKKIYYIIIIILLSISIQNYTTGGIENIVTKNQYSINKNMNYSKEYSNEHRFLVGEINPAKSFSAEQGGNSALDVLIAGLKISSGSFHQSNAFSAFLESSRPRPLSNGGDVAAYFSAKSTGANTNIFGINPLVSDTKGFAGQSLQNELDFNVADSRTHVQGLGVVLNSNQNMSSPPTGFVCRVANMTKWDRCFWTVDGSANVAISIGTKVKGNSSGSMPIEMHGRSASGKLLSASILADLNGSLILRSGSDDGAIGFQNPNGENNGYINSNGISVYKSISSSSFRGLGKTAFNVRQLAAGKGATAFCDSKYVCDSISGTLILRTGNIIEESGDFLDITFPVIRSINPNCNVTGFDKKNFNIPQFGISEVKNDSITLRSGSPLKGLSLYSFTYICAGS